MKSISTYIKEAKFDYKKSVIEFPGYDLKVTKKYVQTLGFKPKLFLEDFLAKYFGWINQWIDKNVKNIVDQVTKENGDFPETIGIKLPKGMSGELRLDWDVYWTDNKPFGKLRGADIEVGRVCPANVSTMEFHDAENDLTNFKLQQEIKF